MKLKNESEEFVPLLRQHVVGQMRNLLRFDRDRAAVGVIEQAKDVEERTLAAAGRTDNRVDGATLELQRYATQRVHARILFAEEAFDIFAAERNFGVHEF